MAPCACGCWRRRPRAATKGPRRVGGGGGVGCCVRESRVTACHPFSFPYHTLSRSIPARARGPCAAPQKGRRGSRALALTTDHGARLPPPRPRLASSRLLTTAEGLRRAEARRAGGRQAGGRRSRAAERRSRGAARPAASCPAAARRGTRAAAPQGSRGAALPGSRAAALRAACQEEAGARKGDLRRAHG